jgi:hypothetical protein
MSSGLLPPRTIVGLIRINNHCLFTWRAMDTHGTAGGDAPRFVEATAEHCRACVDEVVRRGFSVVDLADDSPTPRQKQVAKP